MLIREAITYLVSHLTPMSLVKQIFPAIGQTHAYLHPVNESRPWMNVDRVELTAEDFA